MHAIGTVRVLGSVDASTTDNPVHLPGLRTQELLAALALHAEHGIRRDQLCGSIWPDSPQVTARRALNTELWRLRAAIRDAGGDSDQWIESTSNEVRLCTDNGVAVDLDRFRSVSEGGLGSDPAQIADAVKLYRGDFADGLDAEWIMGMRGQVRRQFVSMLESAVEQLCQRELFDTAASYAERLVDEEPLDERGHRALLLIRIRTGDHAAAVRHFQELRESFQSELGIEPSPATCALVEQLMESTPAPRNFTFDRVEREVAPMGLQQHLARLRETAERLLRQIDEVHREVVRDS